MYEWDSSEQQHYKLFMKSIARAESKEVACCNTHLLNWNPGNENIFGLKQLQNVVHLQDYLVLKYQVWLVINLQLFLLHLQQHVHCMS